MSRSGSFCYSCHEFGAQYVCVECGGCERCCSCGTLVMEPGKWMHRESKTGLQYLRRAAIEREQKLKGPLAAS